MHPGMLSPITALLLAAAAAPAAAPPVPEGPTRAEAAVLVSPKLSPDDAAALADDEKGLSLKPWRQHGGTWVALISDVKEADSNGGASAVLHLALIGRSGPRWVALARVDEARTQDDIGIGDPSYALDLAPYRINENEVAFGVRETADDQTPPHPAKFEKLLLFRVVGSRLVRVLDLPSFFNFTNGDDGSSGSGNTVVAVSSHKNGGFFDLVATETKTYDDEKPTKTVTSYAWVGEAYEESLRSVLLQMKTLDAFQYRAGAALKLVGPSGSSQTLQPKKLDKKRFQKQVKPLLAHDPGRGEQLSCDEQARTCTFSGKPGQTTYRFTPRPSTPKLVEITSRAKGG
jgi:hypothetical protein